MSQETITFRVDLNKRKALDELAVSLDRDRSYVLNETINYYLDMLKMANRENSSNSCRSK